MIGKHILREDVVVFDIEKSAKGPVAKNIRGIDSIDGLVEKLYAASDEKLKGVLLDKYPELYVREFQLYLKKNKCEEKIRSEFEEQLENFNKYVDQFISIDFWNKFEVGVGARWHTVGGRDWTDAWWSYGIESTFTVEKLNKFTTVKDPYILNLLNYWEFILKVDWHTAKHENVRKRKALIFKEDYFKEIKDSIKQKFDREYRREDHVNSLDFYYPKTSIIQQKYLETFSKMVYDNYDEFMSNNLKNNESISLTRREIEEDFEMENFN